MLCLYKANTFVSETLSVFTGWAFYGCVAGTALTFLCAALSMQAERSTSSDKVEREILEGKNLICVA